MAFTSSSPPILACMFSADSLVRTAKEFCLTCGTSSLPEERTLLARRWTLTPSPSNDCCLRFLWMSSVLLAFPLRLGAPIDCGKTWASDHLIPSRWNCDGTPSSANHHKSSQKTTTKIVGLGVSSWGVVWGVGGGGFTPYDILAFFWASHLNPM